MQTDKDEKESLKRLKAIQRGHRSVKTKLITEANEILQGTLNDDDLTQIDVISRLLEEKRMTLNDINQQVLSLCNVETIEFEIEESEEIVEKIVKCRRNIEEATRRHNENQSTLVSQPSTTNGYGHQPTHTQAKATTTTTSSSSSVMLL